MKKVGIADLKAHLSAHLRVVRKGQSVMVMDRNTAVARIVPILKEPAPRLRIREPLRKLHSMPRLPPLSRSVNSLEALLKERRERR